MRQIILPKTDTRYWLKPGKLKMWGRSATYSVYIQSKGQRYSFTLGTANREVAARLAAGICKDVVELGIEATHEKHRPKKPVQEDRVATVGEWIDAAREVAEANEPTFTAYARSLRLIVSGIAAIKKSEKRFGPKSGGSTHYRAQIDTISLDTLTPVALQKWRLAYVKKAPTPVQKKSAETSCNSIIRQARSLFSPKVVRKIPSLLLPDPLPFHEVEFYERKNAKYKSRLDAPAIVAAAHTDLLKKDPQAFLAFLLAIAAGLRRGEIDTLCWHQIDTTEGVIRIENTEVASLKNEESAGDVEIDEQTAGLLKGFRVTSKANDKDYVIRAGGGAGQRKWGQHYRAEIPFQNLISWLRNYEQDGKKPLEKIQKPIHELRKELGALITQKHGIYAASRSLRHSNVATTVAHYADKKERTTVPIGSWITPPQKAAQNRMMKIAKPAKASPSRPRRNPAFR